MKVFTASHDGVWLGGDSVIVAQDKEEAVLLLKSSLKSAGLRTDGFDLKEVDLSKPKAIMLDDGDY